MRAAGRLVGCAALGLLLCGAGGEAALRTQGLLTVAVYKNFEPFSNARAGDYAGVDVALARALASQLKLKLKLLPFDAGEDMSTDLRNMVWRGDILHYGPADLMMHVPVDRRFMAANDQALIFGPYYHETLVLARDVRRLPQANTAADLRGHDVAAEAGSAAASALLGADGGALRDRVRIAETPEAAMQLLLTGKVVAVLVTRAQAEAALHGVSNRSDYAFSTLVLPGMPPGGWSVGLAVKADNKALADELASALAALQRSGELRAIFQAAGLTPPTAP